MKDGGVIGAVVIGALALLTLSRRQPSIAPSSRTTLPLNPVPTPVPMPSSVPSTTFGESAFSFKIVKVQQGITGLLAPGWSNAPRMRQAAVELVEGSTYQIQGAITNRSTRAGIPVAMTFMIDLSAMAPVPLLTQLTLALAAGASTTFRSPNFTIPALTTATTGTISGRLLAGGVVIANASLPVSLVLAAVQPGGTLVLKPTTPFLVSPASGSTLSGNPVTFNFNTGSVLLYRLTAMVGRDTPGNSTYHLSEVLNVPPDVVYSRVVDVSAAPAGAVIWFSLSWQTDVAAVSQQVNYSFTKG